MNRAAEQKYYDRAGESLTAAIDRAERPLDPETQVDIATSLRHLVLTLAKANFHAARQVIELSRLHDEVERLRKGQK